MSAQRPDDLPFRVSDLPEEQLRDYFAKIMQFANGKITMGGQPLDLTLLEAFYLVHAKRQKEMLISMAKSQLQDHYLDYLMGYVSKNDPPPGLTTDDYRAYVIPPEPQGLSLGERIQYYLKRGTGVEDPFNASRRLLMSRIPDENTFFAYGMFLYLKKSEEKGSRKRGADSSSNGQPESKRPRSDEQISAALIKAKGNVDEAVRLLQQ